MGIEVRTLNREEFGKLNECYPDIDISEASGIVVMDNYITDGPGYHGKVVFVLWGGSPTYHDSWRWDSGKEWYGTKKGYKQLRTPKWIENKQRY